jgi:hypothetical protein
MASNQHVDLASLMATAQVILNVCSSSLDSRTKLEAVQYAAAALKHAADATLEQLDIRQSRDEVQHG